MSSPLRTAPYLPPEIIDEILQQAELDKEDLARCCLVNGTWLDSGQKSLYAHVTFIVLHHVDDTFETCCDDEPEEESRYTPSARSSKLLSTLRSNGNLGRFAKTFEFCGKEGSSYIFEGVEREHWMQFSDVLNVLGPLCSNAKRLRIHDPSGLFDEMSWAAVRAHFADSKQIWLRYLAPQDWERLRHFASLREFSAWEASEGLSSREAPLRSLHLPNFSIYQCTWMAYDYIQASIGQSLRSLQLPVELAATLQLSKIPNVYRLVITWSDCYYTLEATQFFRDLEKMTSLKILQIEDEACLSLGDKGAELGRYLPINCRRVNLDYAQRIDYCDFLDAILSVIKPTPTGRRVREIGLPAALRIADTASLRDLRKVVSFELEDAGVELIWCG
ncbi:hypothetical protein JCM16303_006614 [Sporobolomyces ruberrimus]